MFESVLLSAISLSRRASETVKAYMLTMDFIDINPDYRSFHTSQGQIIDAEMKTFNPENSFKVVDCSTIYHSIFTGPKKEKGRHSPYSLLRYLVPSLTFLEGKVIFLDCDTLIRSDIKELKDFDMGEHEIAGVNDFRFRFIRKKDFINSGVLLLNLPVIRKTELFSKIGSSFPEEHFDDIESLNELFSPSFVLLPGGFRFNEQKFIKRDTVIKHFCHGISYGLIGPKDVSSTDVNSVTKRLGIHDFDEDYKIFNSIKERLAKEEEAKVKAKNKRYIIQIRHLFKTYNTTKAVDDVSFNVKRGSLFAFLGINGAGKSTTINIISSILEKDYGDVIVDGHSIDKERNAIKKEIGIVFQTSVLDDVLTAEENLRSRADFYNMSREEKKRKITQLSNMLNLGPILKQPVKSLSGGQRRRLDIARSMVHEPKILILDEPTTGLDPKTRQDVWHLINSIREKTKMTVFLTTHYLEEADKATDVVIMDHGRIIATGTPTELKNRYSKDYVIVYSPKNDILDELSKKKGASYSADGLCYKFPVKDSAEAISFINEHSDLIKDFEVKKGDMDDVFLNVTGQKYKEGDNQ